MRLKRNSKGSYLSSVFLPRGSWMSLLLPSVWEKPQIGAHSSKSIRQFGSEGTAEVLWSNPTKTGQALKLDLVARYLVREGFEYLPGWRLHYQYLVVPFNIWPPLLRKVGYFLKYFVSLLQLVYCVLVVFCCVWFLFIFTAQLGE